MLSYVTIGAKDPDEAVKFYDAVLKPLGVERAFFQGGWAGYAPGGDPEKVSLMVCTPSNGEPARGGNGIMIGLSADTPEQVDAFYAAAMANGATDEGPAGPRPQYGPTYYLAYVRDPTGNKLAVMCKSYQAPA
ncbi:MAG TPA: VOC family protein [Caulobacteraceae bacterium]|jgi:catechol 2,3-dioxygenase-like lactoylglutathione lyase family enzyme